MACCPAAVDVALSIFSSSALLAARVTEATRMPPLASRYDIGYLARGIGIVRSRNVA